MLCLLGLEPEALGVHKETVQFPLMLARKTIMPKWVGSDAPSARLWRLLVSEVVLLERLRFCLSGKPHLLRKVGNDCAVLYCKNKKNIAHCVHLRLNFSTGCNGTTDFIV